MISILILIWFTDSIVDFSTGFVGICGGICNARISIGIYFGNGIRRGNGSRNENGIDIGIGVGIAIGIVIGIVIGIGIGTGIVTVYLNIELINYQRKNCYFPILPL